MTEETLAEVVQRLVEATPIPFRKQIFDRYCPDSGWDWRHIHLVLPKSANTSTAIDIDQYNWIHFSEYTDVPIVLSEESNLHESLKPKETT